MLIILVGHIIGASRGPRFVLVYAVNYKSHIDIVGGIFDKIGTIQGRLVHLLIIYFNKTKQKGPICNLSPPFI